MASLIYLLILYVAVVITNVLVMFLFWRSTGLRHFRTLMLSWLMGILVLIAGAVTANQSLFLMILGYSASFFFYSGIALLLAQMIQLRFPGRLFIYLFAGSLVSAFILTRTAAPPRLAVLLVAVTTGLPAIYVGGLAVFRYWGKISLALKGYAIMLFLNGLHSLDFAYAYSNPELVKAGFTLGIFLGIALTLFCPCALLEMFALEAGKLELELSFRSKLSQAAKFSALGEMAGGVAHEINNPLAIVQLNAELAKELLSHEPLNRALIDGRLTVILTTVARISKIILGLRTFSRDGSLDPKKLESINTIIENTVALCAEKYREQGVDISARYSHISPSVQCRAVEISQVLLNLLNNARDAVSGSETKSVVVQCVVHGTQVDVSVSDSGPGIPKELEEKVFQPFFTTKELGKGTGLGLSISKGLAESNHGTLLLDTSSPGTRFVLSLPIAS